MKRKNDSISRIIDPQKNRLSRALALQVVFLFGAMFANTSTAGDWGQFRGPNGGLADSTIETPVDIGPDKHILWKVQLPPGHSSPIVMGSKIFLTAVKDKKQLLTMALDRSSGKLLWEREAEYEKLESIHNIGSHAQCTPASDGDCVVSFFGSCGLFCYSNDGELRWHVPMGPFNDDFGAASSPLILDDRVLLGQDHDSGSFVAAYDKKTGKQIWSTDRSEFSRNFGSPMIWTVDGKRQVVIAGTLQVRGYDWETGSQLWTVRGISRVVCMTPVVAPDNHLIVAGWSAGGEPGERISLEPFEQVATTLDIDKNGNFDKSEIKDGPLQSRFTQCDRNKDGQISKAEYDEFRTLFDRSQNSVLSIKPGALGDSTDSHIQWKFNKFVPFCSSPLVYRERLFLMKDGGILTCLNAKTGAARKTGRLPATGAYYASPVAANGCIYLLSEKGQLSVVSAEDLWQVLHSADFGESTHATPAIVDGRIYLRTSGHLYCFGNSQN